MLIGDPDANISDCSRTICAKIYAISSGGDRASDRNLGGSVTTHRRVCGLCGRAFAIYIPPGDHETERDKLCGECATLPKPPVVPEEQAPLKTGPLNSGNG